MLFHLLTTARDGQPEPLEPCGGDAAIELAVEERVRRRVFVAQELADITLSIAFANDGSRAIIVESTRVGVELGRRDVPLPPNDCAKSLETIAVVLAIMIGPERKTTEPPPGVPTRPTAEVTRLGGALLGCVELIRSSATGLSRRGRFGRRQRGGQLADAVHGASPDAARLAKIGAGHGRRTRRSATPYSIRSSPPVSALRLRSRPLPTRGPILRPDMQRPSRADSRRRRRSCCSQLRRSRVCSRSDR